MGSVVLCNHDQGFKMDPGRFSSWCRVAHTEVDNVSAEAIRTQGPGHLASRQLWLLGQGARVDAALRAAAPAAVRGQIAFAKKVAVRDHVRRLRLCHVALDTAGIGGHTTAANYLWARVPLVTLAGQHVMSRVAASLLLALSRDVRSGCSAATLARSEQDYVAVARALAKGAAAAAVAAGGVSHRRVRGGGGSGATPEEGAGSVPEAQAAYEGVGRCLRAATAPLDALGPTSLLPRRGGGGRRGSTATRDASASTGASAAALFDTARWVRDWERALSLAVEVSLASSVSSSGHEAAVQGAGEVRFSLIVSG